MLSSPVRRIESSDSCFHCNLPIGFNATYYVIRKAIKPPFRPYRWTEIGRCCEDCELKGNPLSYDNYVKDRIV